MSHAADDAKQMGKFNVLHGVTALMHPLAIDRETFDVMWELSAPGGDAEHCFFRIPQTDYLFDGRDECLDWMPNVILYTLALCSYY